MADELEQIKNILGGNKSNINTNYDSANTGLNLDQSVNQIPKGKLTYALNAAVENFDANSTSYQNESGNEFCLNFPDGYQLIGEHFIVEKNKHVFFLANPTTGGSEIGYMDNNDCIYHTLINASCLNFTINHPIHKAVHKITNCTTEIYWTDGYNPRRWLDINNVPYIQVNNGGCNPVYINELDCNQLNIQPNFNIPNVEVVDVNSGGDLQAGTYQFAIQYCAPNGDGYTSFFSVTNPTPIANTQITTPEFNYTVGKSIDIEISNLDTTGEFQYFNLAVIKTINAITSVELVGIYFIDNVTKRITYTGQNTTQIRLTINDIFEKYPYYEIAQDLTAVRDILVWDNLTSVDRINYQQIANNITLQWETYRIPATENYANELNATNLRGYLRDEVYAFEIVFLLKNGKQTDGFHIPGRVVNANDLTGVISTNPDCIGDPDYSAGGVSYHYYWKVYNTATIEGTNPQYLPTTDYKGPYQYGNFSYWESTEVYPCNTDVWGDLANQPIRHHKFPDISVSPIYESALFTSAGGMVMQKDAIYPIGVKLDISQIQSLINLSNLTQEQKNNIAGFKIVRGDRSTNKSIVAKGILRNVGKYTKEEQDFYYPNYPYNDIRVDPFLLNGSNSYTTNADIAASSICRSFTITAKGQATVQYTDCTTGATVIKEMLSGETLTICALDFPGPIVTGSTCVVSNTYTIYKIRTARTTFKIYPPKPINSSYSPPSGYASWCDYCAVNPTSVHCNALKPVNLQVACTNSLGQWIRDYVLVASLVPPTYVNMEQDFVIEEYEQVGYSCNPTNLEGFKSDSEFRYVFNSPETSFGTPTLGNILKLENVIFGAGKAHFTQVKKNALYKLVSAEAQQDALNSSYAISGGDITAMFTAYQTYLTIYLNGITAKNFAYSYNSIASYDYSVSVDNNLGVKQRELDIVQYLIPGVQSVGDTHVINNFQRESSVYLKTKGNSSLPFASNSPNMIASGTSLVSDKSRYVLSDINCTTPAKKVDINVVSYYGSLKNTFVNQWGQMYSYDTIDTGFQRDITPVTSPVWDTIFGGDTFIGKFAFKTKLPFFFDNRVGAPDGSDIYYDEIGNVAYPKYWHSARSVLANGIGGGTDLTNFISIKAHNFDCPNSQTPEKSFGRTYYDGKFYLFAYGIPYFYCESSYNVDLRQAFNNKEGDFWPHVSTSIPDDWVQESFVSIANDNTYYYNTTFSKQNKENTFTHLPIDWSSDLCFTYFPFRAIYSEEQNIDPTNKTNNWLTYKAISYFDFPQTYGNLISLDGIQNKAVLARFENKSLLYNTMLTINTSNPQAAYLGNDTLFKSSPPIDFAETDLGYVGSQHKMLLKIPQGQITIDAKRGQVFLISGTNITDISAFGSGLNRFFTDHLAFEILRHFPNVDVDNHFNGIGLHGVYDSKFDRVIISKLDYIPKSSAVKYDASTNEFYIEKTFDTENVATQRVVVYLSDTEYFCNKSWTLSYNINTQSWISFHSYIPNWYIAENNFFYSGQNDCCSTFDAVVAEVLPQPATTTTTSTSTTTTTSTSTTSTTTTAYTGCDVVGVASELYCTLAGTAVVLDVTTTTTSTSSTTTTSTSSTSTTTTTSTSTTTTTTATPVPSIDVYAKNVGTGPNPDPIIEYTINGGSVITASTVSGPSCASYFSITGLTIGDSVVFTTQQGYSMDGDVGSYSCPISGGSLTYTHTVGAGVNYISLFTDSDHYA